MSIESFPSKGAAPQPPPYPLPSFSKFAVQARPPSGSASPRGGLIHAGMLIFFFFLFYCYQLLWIPSWYSANPERYRVATLANPSTPDGAGNRFRNAHPARDQASNCKVDLPTVPRGEAGRKEYDRRCVGMQICKFGGIGCGPRSQDA